MYCLWRRTGPAQLTPTAARIFTCNPQSIPASRLPSPREVDPRAARRTSIDTHGGEAEPASNISCTAAGKSGSQPLIP
ncbi:hypothetical protein C8Q74DRAFT_1244034, partial [Fomes fomentarius]